MGFATLSQEGVDAAGLLVRGRERAAFSGTLSGSGADAGGDARRGTERCFRPLSRETAQNTPSIVKNVREPQVTDDIPGARA